MKIGETWENKSSYMKVIITDLYEDYIGPIGRGSIDLRVCFEYIKESGEKSGVDSSLSRRNFLICYKKVYYENRRNLGQKRS